MKRIHSPAASAEINLGCEYRERIGRDAGAQTLLAYLSQRYRHSTAEQWAAHIANGLVRINSQPAHCESELPIGCELTWRRPPWIEPAAPKSFSVIYEDDDLLAVAKPAGLPTLPGANFLQATLLYQVQRYTPEAAPVHRLGRWTSGLVLCARNQHARANLAKQWTNHAVRKRYLALACGLPGWNSITIAAPIGRVPHALLGSVHAAAANGKPALSHVTLLERRADSVLCDVSIVTGRPHQIRIHLAVTGHPLIGDPLYQIGGCPSPDSHALPGDPGYYLHAAELRFQHPGTGKELFLKCEPPATLRSG